MSRQDETSKGGWQDPKDEREGVGAGWGISKEQIAKLHGEGEIVLLNELSESVLGQQEGDISYIYDVDGFTDGNEFPVRIDSILRNDDGTVNVTLVLIQKA